MKIGMKTLSFLACVLTGVNSASADNYLTWQLNSVTTSEAGSLTGFFTVDTTTQQVTDWNFQIQYQDPDFESPFTEYYSQAGGFNASLYGSGISVSSTIHDPLGLYLGTASTLFSPNPHSTLNLGTSVIVEYGTLAITGGFISAVPEPDTLCLLTAGLAVGGLLRNRARSA